MSFQFFVTTATMSRLPRRSSESGAASGGLRPVSRWLWCAAQATRHSGGHMANDHDTKQNFSTYDGFIKLVKWGTPAFILLMLVVLYFTT
jgi:Bacterial aa3 type cytochrome c oxidase subunit IV